MAVIEIDVNGIPDLITEVLKIAGSLDPGRFLWFRGLNKSSHHLLPKILRDGKQAPEVFERELRLLTRFRQRSLAYWSEGYSQTDWEHLFAMQHYGLPTRLLDWSENLFVAAYFALSSTPNNAEDPPAIWCVDPVAWNRATPYLSGFGETIHILTTADDEADSYRPVTNKKRLAPPLALFGTHNSDRIVAQRGTFMVWGNDTRPLEDFAAEYPSTIWKIKLRDQQESLTRSLQALGFNETMIFPEMPSLAIELSRVEGWRT